MLLIIEASVSKLCFFFQDFLRHKVKVFSFEVLAVVSLGTRSQLAAHSPETRILSITSELLSIFF